MEPLLKIMFLTHSIPCLHRLWPLVVSLSGQFPAFPPQRGESLESLCWGCWHSSEAGFRVWSPDTTAVPRDISPYRREEAKVLHSLVLTFMGDWFNSIISFKHWIEEKASYLSCTLDILHSFDAIMDQAGATLATEVFLSTNCQRNLWCGVMCKQVWIEKRATSCWMCSR